MIMIIDFRVGHVVVASFAPSLRSGANDATRATNKQYALQKSSYCPILCNSETKFTQLILVQNFSNIITVFNIDDVPVSIKQLKTREESNCSEIGWRN